jgi:hypothetical protein
MELLLVSIMEIQNVKTKLFPHVLHDGSGEVTVLVEPSCRSTKGAFKSETVRQRELFPHHNSRCRLFRLLNREVAALKVKGVAFLMKHEWEDLLSQSQSLLFILTSIHEEILVSRVTMNVHIERDFP